MKTLDLDTSAVATAVRLVADAHLEFRTKDVSEHPAMLEAHPEPRDRDYHATVGRYLSEAQDKLGISIVQRGSNPRGALWRGSGGAREPGSSRADDGRSHDARTLDADDLSDAIGPQCARDNPFTARMRFHQSWYRATVLGAPFGTGPTLTSTSSYGSMLTAQDADAGRNFLTSEIFEVVTARIARSTDRVERFRLLHNMLSSQPLCFNIFGPLVRRVDRAARLLTGLWPEIARVNAVDIEHAPEPPHEYLDDGTSFDAFVDFESRDGTRGLIAIETKLTDSFSPKRRDKPAYRRWMSGARHVWKAGVEDAVVHPRHNQLWRNHLLAIAMRDRPGSRFTTCRSIVIRHPLDADGARAVASYRELLRDDEPSFSEVPLDHLVRAFDEAASDDGERSWLAALRLRYLEVDASDPAWRRRNP